MRHFNASGSADGVFLLPGEASQEHRFSDSSQGSITPLWAPRGLSHPIISRSHSPPQAGPHLALEGMPPPGPRGTPWPSHSHQGFWCCPLLQTPLVLPPLCSQHHGSKPAPNMLEIPPLRFSPEQSCKLPLNSCQHLETQRPLHRAVLGGKTVDTSRSNSVPTTVPPPFCSPGY